MNVVVPLGNGNNAVDVVVAALVFALGLCLFVLGRSVYLHSPLGGGGGR